MSEAPWSSRDFLPWLKSLGRDNRNSQSLFLATSLPVSTSILDWFRYWPQRYKSQMELGLFSSRLWVKYQHGQDFDRCNGDQWLIRYLLSSGRNIFYWAPMVLFVAFQAAATQVPTSVFQTYLCSRNKAWPLHFNTVDSPVLYYFGLLPPFLDLQSSPPEGQLLQICTLKSSCQSHSASGFYQLSWHLEWDLSLEISLLKQTDGNGPCTSCYGFRDLWQSFSFSSCLRLWAPLSR